MTQIINTLTSRSEKVMCLVRHLTVKCLEMNIFSEVISHRRCSEQNLRFFISAGSEAVSRTSPRGGQGPGTSTGLSVECLHTRTQWLLHASVAVNTASTYKNAISCFNDFRSKYGFPLVFHGQVDHIVMFICYCFKRVFLLQPLSLTFQA